MRRTSAGAQLMRRAWSGLRISSSNSSSSSSGNAASSAHSSPHAAPLSMAWIRSTISVGWYGLARKSRWSLCVSSSLFVRRT